MSRRGDAATEAQAASESQISKLKESLDRETELGAQLTHNLSARETELSDLKAKFADADRTATGLQEKLEASATQIKALEEQNTSLDTTLSSERTSMSTRSANLTDEAHLLKARVGELESKLSDRSNEVEKLQRTVESFESKVQGLDAQLASRGTELEETRHSMGVETEGLNKTLSEKDAAAAKLSDEVSFLQQQLAQSNTQLTKLQADHRQLQEGSAKRESDLREQAGSSSEQFSKLRNSTDRQISDLQKTSNDFRTQLEASVADGAKLTERLDDALERLSTTERAAAKEKKSQGSRIQHLESRLEKKTLNLEQTTVDFNRTKVEGSTSEHTLRATLRMLEKRDIAGRKQMQQRDDYVKELETEKRVLSRENSTLIEEVKDALAQLTHLRRQVAPLSRKVGEQEDLLRHKLSRPVQGATPARKASTLALHLETLKLRLGKFITSIKQGSPEKRIFALLGVLAVLLITVTAVTRMFPESKPAPVEKKPIGPAAEPTDVAETFMKDAPDLSMAPSKTPLVADVKQKVHSWPGISVTGVNTEYGEFECILTLRPDLFSGGTTFATEGADRLSLITTSHGELIRDYRIVITGLSEANYEETSGDQIEDYSLRIRRAKVAREAMLADGSLIPEHVTISAGGPSDPNAKSVIMSLQKDPQH